MQPNPGFDFPNPREFSRPGMITDIMQPGMITDIMQPGLMQPCTDDIVDTFEPLHELLSNRSGMGSSFPQEPADTQPSTVLEQNNATSLMTGTSTSTNQSSTVSSDIYASLMTPQPQMDPQSDPTAKLLLPKSI